MKRFLAVFAVFMLVFTTLPLFVSATTVTTVSPNEGDDVGLVPYALISEPPDLPTTCFWVMDKPGLYDNKVDRNANAILFCLVFPFVYEQSVFEQEITVTLDLLSNGQKLTISAPNMGGNPVYCYVYDLNGNYKNSYSWMLPSGSAALNGFTYTFTFTSGHTRYWFKGPMSFKMTSNTYRPAQIVWRDDAVYTKQLRDIMLQLNYIFGCGVAIGQQIENTGDEIVDSISDLYSSFVLYQEAFDAFAYRQDVTLRGISGKLDTIIDLLGGNDVVSTMPSYNDEASQVDQYVSAEGGYMDSFDRNIDSFGSVIGDAGSHLQSVSGGFSAVKLLFENFVLSFNLPYLLIFFSLVFGVFILILGKRV